MNQQLGAEDCGKAEPAPSRFLKGKQSISGSNRLISEDIISSFCASLVGFTPLPMQVLKPDQPKPICRRINGLYTYYNPGEHQKKVFLIRAESGFERLDMKCPSV